MSEDVVSIEAQLSDTEDDEDNLRETDKGETEEDVGEVQDVIETEDATEETGCEDVHQEIDAGLGMSLRPSDSEERHCGRPTTGAGLLSKKVKSPGLRLVLKLGFSNMRRGKGQHRIKKLLKRPPNPFFEVAVRHSRCEKW